MASCLLTGPVDQGTRKPSRKTPKTGGAVVPKIVPGITAMVSPRCSAMKESPSITTPKNIAGELTWLNLTRHYVLPYYLARDIQSIEGLSRYLSCLTTNHLFAILSNFFLSLPIILDAIKALLLLISPFFIRRYTGLKKSSKMTAASEFNAELTELIKSKQ